ncbi:MAG: DUF4974 domain-containing protein [Cyclobacteriaceae bacterium]
MKYEEFSTEDFINDESFQSFARGLKEEDERFWINWLKQNPNKQIEFDEARELLAAFSIKELKVQESTFHQDLDRLQSTMNGAKGVKLSIQKSLSWTIKIAASIILVLGIAYFLQDNSAIEDNNAIVELTLLEKSTPKGQKTTFMLPDGSKVKLNSDSYIKYEEVKERRNVYLAGEAFFEVTKDADRPFTVFSGNVQTTALGTSFNVRAYPDDQVTKVYLATGKVKVSEFNKEEGETLMLEPGDAAGYDKDLGKLAYRSFSAENSLSWSEGTIIFDNAEFHEVKKVLERWYGVNIHVNRNPDSGWRINGSFKNESLENILNSIHFTTPFQYSLSEKNVKIKF